MGERDPFKDDSPTVLTTRLQYLKLSRARQIDIGDIVPMIAHTYLGSLKLPTPASCILHLRSQSTIRGGTAISTPHGASNVSPHQYQVNILFRQYILGSFGSQSICPNAVHPGIIYI